VVAHIKSTGTPDLAVVVNDGPSDAAAAVFTRNRVKAAPVLWSQQAVADHRLRAVVLNSGGANACTGPEGLRDSRRSAEHLANLLGTGSGEIAVCSTGLIGQRLPMDQLCSGIDAAAAALSSQGGPDAAEAIRTTDTVAKQDLFRGPDGWAVGGMAKGAGMLAPSLATMLCVLTTDALVDAAHLEVSLHSAVSHSFERLDSDGCLSTNDTVLLLASGASGIEPGPAHFDAAVEAVCTNLARALLADAEGATKEITIDVRGVASEPEALEVGRAIARNNLLKCALFGNDPNWGRVLAAIGTTSAGFDPGRIDVAINGVHVCRDGAAGEPRERVDLSGRTVHIDVDLHHGRQAATIWTNDLSHAYVEENSAYSS
jgi:glutamate N-acetyltransferase/amino-acid N-acetyltransferase